MVTAAATAPIRRCRWRRRAGPSRAARSVQSGAGAGAARARGSGAAGGAARSPADRRSRSVLLSAGCDDVGLELVAQLAERLVGLALDGAHGDPEGRGRVDLAQVEVVAQDHAGSSPRRQVIQRLDEIEIHGGAGLTRCRALRGQLARRVQRLLGPPGGAFGPGLWPGWPPFGADRQARRPGHAGSGDAGTGARTPPGSAPRPPPGHGTAPRPAGRSRRSARRRRDPAGRHRPPSSGPPHRGSPHQDDAPHRKVAPPGGSTTRRTGRQG